MMRSIRAFDLALRCAAVWVLSSAAALALRPDAALEVYESSRAPASVGPAGAARQRAAAGLAGVDIRWSAERGIPELVTATNLPVVGPLPQASAADPAARAVRMMAGLAPAYGIRDADAELTAVRTVTDEAGYRHVRLQQVYEGVPVFGSELIVHIDAEGRGRAVNGRFVPGLSLSVTPTLKPADAARAAGADLARQGKPSGTLESAPRLVVWTRGASPALAYYLIVKYRAADGPARWGYAIDAQSGAVLFRNDELRRASTPISGTILAGEGGGVKTVTGWATGGLYYLLNWVESWVILNYGTGAGAGQIDEGDLAYRTIPNWGNTDPTEMSAAVNLAKIQTYWSAVHGRNSFDGYSAMAWVYVHYGSSLVNAFWDGSEILVGDGDGSTANPLAVLDVLAHEFQHAVTDYSVYMTYAYESGALNESWSDIFGALVEFNSQPDGRAAYPKAVKGKADWLMGEDCWKASVCLRDMRDPKSRITQGDGNQSPSRYKGTYWYSWSGDNGGVHINSGVQNFYFYLLCEGGRGTNDGIGYDMTGIGITNGGKLAYLTLSSYVPADPSYSDSRAAWVAAAQEADATPGMLTTKAQARVLAAWAACGLGYPDRVIPPYGFTTSGEPGVGPFAPESRVYGILNVGATTETWQVSATQPWLLIDPAVVSIEAGAVGSVTVSVDQVSAISMSEGVYRDTVTFDNMTSGLGSTTRRAMLRAGANYAVRSAPYNWVDPVSAGHSFVPLSDGVSAAQTIPFDFSLYGVPFSQLYISDCGVVGCFNDALTGGANAALPQQDAPNAIVCPMWDDLTGSPDLRVYVGESVVDGVRCLVITWMDATHVNDPAVRYSFQALIRENATPGDDNDVVFQYLTVSENDLMYGNGISASVGMEDEGGGAAVSYAYEGSAWLSDTQSVLLTRNPPVDVTAPDVNISVYADVPGATTFELRFSEIVTNLDASDFALLGTLAPDSVVSLIQGGGLRYLVTVSGYTNIYGSIGFELPAGSVYDMDGNPNGAYLPYLYVLPVRVPVYANQFEDGPVDWTPSIDVSGPYASSGWEYGAPAYAGGPTNTPSGSNCWGTVLAGPYYDNMDAWLEGVPVVVGEKPRVVFSAWYSLAAYDYGYVEVFDGSVWRNVTPGGGFTGGSGGWVREEVALPTSSFGHRSIRVRFRVVSDAVGTAAGMYVDDVQVQTAVTNSLWVVGYAPTNVPPGGTYPVDLSLYNLTLTTRTGATGVVRIPSAGVRLLGTNVVSYGVLVPGEVGTVTSAVQIVVDPIADLGVSKAELFHEASAVDVAVVQQVLPISIDGMNETVGTNRVTATCGLGVFDWMGRRLSGNGDVYSALLQLIEAGTNGLIDPPGASGAPSGDDRVLLALPSGATFGRFGEGYLIPPNAGRFTKTFKHGLSPGTKLYVRAWDAPSFDGSVAYGESALYSVASGAAQTNDFVTWVVSRPWNYFRDSDGDSVPDGWCVLNGRDPRLPVVGLANQWSASGAAGSSGNGPLNLLYPARVAEHGGFVYVADTQNSRIQIWDATLGTRVGWFGSPGTGAGYFNQPQGLAIDAARSRLLVADSANHRIVVLAITPGTGALTYLSSFGSSGSIAGRFNRPYGVAVDAGGMVYVADSLNHRIQVFASDYSPAWLFSAGLKPYSVAVNSTGIVYVADYDGNRILMYATNGTSLGSSGTAGGGAGQFSKPADVRIGVGGRVYVADMANHRVQVFRADMTFLGAYAPPLGSMGSSPGQLWFPQGVWPKLDDNVAYVADTWNHRVQRMKITIDGDGDGMDDVWEDLHGLDSSDPSDGGADSDGDGVKNVGEYRIGTDPRNIDSNGDGLYDGGALGLVTTVAPGQIVDVGPGVPMILQWNSSSGGVYEVQTRLDLLDPSGWKPAATVTSWFNNVFTWPVDVSALPETNRFYRYIHLNP